MNVVEFLVEKVGVSVNAQFRKTSRVTKVAGGALHKLALGRSWWHVYKALPYLIENGANLELRSEDRVTPLHAALHTYRKRGPFHRNAAMILIESGADVNAVDANGQTCLSKAGTDLEMTKLLIAHGAHVNATAIFSAIELRETVILETLLSHGDYANLRRSAVVTPGLRRGYRPNILDSEVSPLLFASAPTLRFTESDVSKPSVRSNNLDKDVLDARIMTILLNHGADPFATYVGELSPRDLYDLDSPNIWHPQIELQRKTVIHEILKSGHTFGPFFQLPSLQLERRDSSGCTLLLAASQSEITLRGRSTITNPTFRELIDRGADVTAQDNDGNTILHHIRPPRLPFRFIVPLKADSELLKTLKLSQEILVFSISAIERAKHSFPASCF
jgi:hypothetical protein